MEVEALLHLAQKRSISELEIYHVRSHSNPVCFESNHLKQIESSQATGVALRLWNNGCPGLAVAYGDFNPDDLIDKALAISALNSPEIPLLNGGYQIIDNPTPLYQEVEELITQGRSAIALLREENPEILCNLDLEKQTETTTLINSKGLYCQHTHTSLSASIGVEWIREEDFLGIYDDIYSHEILDLTKTIESIKQRLQWAKKHSIITSQKIPILFTPNAVTSLWETLSDALNGKRILDKSSPWHDCHGKKVISPCLTLSQQADFQPYNCLFDDEGTATSSYNLIEAGKISNYYTDKLNADKLGITNTGNGFRPSLGSYPTPELINLIVKNGSTTFEKLIKNIDYGLMVDQILGNDADISGDFSLNLDLGYLVQKGEIVGRVKDTMISGNVYQALKQVQDLGNDNRWSGSCYTPSMVIDSLSVTN